MACVGCTTQMLAEAAGGTFVNMADTDPNKEWPAFREFGWTLKEKEGTTFDCQYHSKTGQFVIIANFPLIRGITCEMIYWWFTYLPNLKVKMVCDTLQEK